MRAKNWQKPLPWLVVAALLWLFQIVLLDPFYRAVKTTEVKATAETVQHELNGGM